MTGTIYHAPNGGGQPDCNFITTVSSNLPGSSAINIVAASAGSDLFEWDASSGTCVDNNHQYGPEYFNSGGDRWFSDDQTNWYFYEPGGAGWNSTSVTCPGGGGSAPTISSHPSDGSDVCVGGSPSTMSITASGATSYQWYSNLSNSNSGGSLILGETSASYTPLTISSGTTYYYCVATNGNGSTSSNTARQIVNANPSSVTVSGGGNTCGTRTLTASGGSGGTIYWQNTTSSGTSTSTASSSQDISLTGTYYFRSRSSAGCWGNSGFSFSH